MKRGLHELSAKASETSGGVKFDAERLRSEVPGCLRELRQWVCWRFIVRNGKTTKCPMRADGRGKAKSHDPATWSTFDEAVARCEKQKDFAGVGFCFAPDDPYTGIDLDDCVDGIGQVRPWARLILDQVNSYSETSPSTKGIKAIVRALKPGPHCKKPHGKIEIYDRDRYFCVTARRLAEFSAAVESRQDVLDALYGSLFGEQRKPSVPLVNPPNNNPSPHDDSPINTVLSRLVGVTTTSEGWKSLCPVHNDSRPSLSIGLGTNGKVLLTCHAMTGCTFASIVAALGMEQKDMFPQNPPPAKRTGRDSTSKLGKVVATYNYLNERGTLVYQKLRYEPKDFRQRRPNNTKGGKSWLWDIKGVHRILYRLPQLLKVDPKEWMFICEGEKDCDTLFQKGLIATTNCGGAGKWAQTDDTPLIGRRVVVVPDNDTPGEDHAADVASRLHGRAAEIRMVRLPRGKDATEFFEQGGTVEELKNLVEAAATWEPVICSNDGEETGKNRSTVESGASQRTAPKGKPKGVSDSELLVRLAEDKYRIGLSDDGEPFAVDQTGPNVAVMFRGSRDALRAALSPEFRREFHTTPSQTALADALTNLSGAAMDSAAEPVYLRVANHNDAIIVDLGDTSGAAIVVNANGWRTVNDSPVLFRRTALTSPLPAPGKGGDLQELRDLLNVTEDSWPLVLGWLVAAFIPTIDHPVLMLGGSQGTGKTTAARMLISLFDPSPAPLRSPPRDIEQWGVAASSSWAVGIDNVSSITAWWSDALCKAVTGDGLLRRRLYTDSELSVLSFRRVVCVTSIDAGALRGDLGDRLLLVDLESITQNRRRSESELASTFQTRRPFILGALLDLVSSVLRILPGINVPLARLAEFSRILAAIDQTVETVGYNIYLGQRGRIAGDVVESSLVGAAILRLVEAEPGVWQGTAAQLSDRLKPEKPCAEWPKTPRALAGIVKRLVPALEAVGVTIDRLRPREYRVSREEAVSTVATVEPSKTPIGAIENAVLPLTVDPRYVRVNRHDAHVGETVPSNRQPNRHVENPIGAIEKAVFDGTDGCDGQIHPISGHGAVVHEADPIDAVEREKIVL